MHSYLLTMYLAFSYRYIVWLLSEFYCVRMNLKHCFFSHKKEAASSGIAYGSMVRSCMNEKLPCLNVEYFCMYVNR